MWIGNEPENEQINGDFPLAIERKMWTERDDETRNLSLMSAEKYRTMGTKEEDRVLEICSKND